MPQSNYVHLVDGSSTRRGAISFQLTRRDLHVEIYETAADLTRERPVNTGETKFAYPQQGALLISDDEAIDFAATIELLHENGCFIPVVAFTDRAVKARRIVEALRAGALEYLVLPEDYSRVADVLDDVVHHADEIATRIRRVNAARRRLGMLSDREAQVLALMTRGASNKDTARTLGISHRTVEIHRANVIQKLDATSSVEAAAILIASGFDIHADFELPDGSEPDEAQRLAS